MKVLHLLRKGAQLNSTFIRNQVCAGIKSQCLVAFYEPSNEILERQLKTVEKTIDIVSLNQQPGRLSRWYYKIRRIIDPVARKVLIELINNYQPSVIHLHYGTDAGIFLPVLKECKIPTFVSFYGYDAFSFPRRCFGLGSLYLKRRVFNRASKILAMSEVMAHDLRKIGCLDSKILIHYHGVPACLASISRSYTQKETVSLLMLSYLDPVKGHLFVLNSLKILVQKGIRNFHLNVYGYGHYRNQIESAIRNLNLSDFVTMHGKIEYLSKEYYSAFESADVFLHPSITTMEDKEGIPGALVEAMFSALPSIATYHGGIPCVIQNGQSGILIRESDSIELAGAIESLMLDVALRERMGQFARQYALNHLDINVRQISLEDHFAQFC